MYGRDRRLEGGELERVAGGVETDENGVAGCVGRAVDVAGGRERRSMGRKRGEIRAGGFGYGEDGKSRAFATRAIRKAELDAPIT